MDKEPSFHAEVVELFLKLYTSSIDCIVIVLSELLVGLTPPACDLVFMLNFGERFFQSEIVMYFNS